MKTFEQWMEDLQDRMGQVFNASDPDHKQKIQQWNSDPRQAYQNPRQAKEMEQKARGRAELINRKYNNQVRVYKTIAPDNFEQRIFNVINSTHQTSVSVGEKAKGVWNTELILSGVGRIEYYYAKDVSTNDTSANQDSLERVPLTPLNKFRSHYDEALVVGKNIKWDNLYYDDKIVQQIPEFTSIVQKFNLNAISTNQKGLPSPIVYTKELEKSQKLKLDT